MPNPCCVPFVIHQKRIFHIFLNCTSGVLCPSPLQAISLNNVIDNPTRKYSSSIAKFLILKILRLVRNYGVGGDIFLQGL